MTDVFEAARLLADAIEPLLNLRYAFFGYSLGALIAFELIRELRRRGVPMPEQLFVGARSAPHLPIQPPPMAHLPHDRFLEQARYYYDPPADAWNNPDLLDLILPVLRADMALSEGYLYRPEPSFGFPIQAFAGLRDRSASTSAVQAWREHTTGNFDVEVFDGAHFFVTGSLARVHKTIITRLEHIIMQRAV